MTLERMIQVGVLVGMIVGAIAFFQTSEEAEAQEQTTSEYREVGDLRNQLEIVKLKIQRFADLTAVRALSEAEKIELRSLERERDIILTRLTELGR